MRSACTTIAIPHLPPTPTTIMPNSNRHTAPNTQTQIRRLPSDYERIREENEREYGLGIERWGEGGLHRWSSPIRLLRKSRR